MKKFAKILIVMLAVCLTVGVFAITASAQKTFPGVSQTFVVDGVGYGSLQKAVDAAQETGGTVYLNKNAQSGNNSTSDAKVSTYLIKDKNNIGAGYIGWKGDTYERFEGTVGCVITGDVTIDLNGYNLTQTAQATSSLFHVKSGTLTITGEGELKNVRTAFNVQGENAKLVIDSTGSGIKISNKGDSRGYCYPIFIAENGSTMDISGYLEIAPSHVSTMIFRLAGPTYTALDGAKEVNFDTAKVVVNPATTAPAGTVNSNELNTMFYLMDGTDINIVNGSHLEIDTRMFWLPTQKTGTTVDITDKLAPNSQPLPDADFSSLSMPEAEVNVNVKNSALVVNGNPAYTQSNNGTLFQFDNARIRADFVKAELVGGSRVFVGSSNGASNKTDTKKINQNQFTFTDCTFNRATGYNNSSSILFYNGINVKWVGGSIDNRDYTVTTTAKYAPTAVNTYLYQELSEGFFGVLLTDCALNGTAPSLPESVDGSNWAYIFSTHEKVTLNPLVVENGAAKSYTHYFGNGSFADVEKAFSGDGMTLDYVKENNVASGVNEFGSVITVYKAPGKVAEAVEENGNGYFKVTYDAGNIGGVNTEYLQINSGNSSYGFDKYNAFVTEFDIRAENGAFSNYTAFIYQGRVTNPRYDKDGNHLGDQRSYSPSGVPQLRFRNGGDVYLGNSDTGIDVPVDGTWTRVTYILEVNISDTIEEKNVQAYKLEGSSYVADGENLTATKIALRKVTGYIHYYINGEHLVSANIMPESYGYGGYVAVGYENKLFAEALRIEGDYTPGTGFGLDNFRISAYEPKDNVNLGVSENGVAVESIKDNPLFLVMPDNNKEYIGSVDGTLYDKLDELTAAVQDGSVVTLNDSIAEKLNVDKSFVIKLQGNTISGIISATHKSAAYTGMDIIKFKPASQDEIFEAVYKNEHFGIDKTYNVVLGTYYPITDEVSSSLDLPFDGSFNKLLGWSDKDGALIVDLEDVGGDGKITLTPVFDSRAYYYTTQVEGETPVYNLVSAESLVDTVNTLIAENPGKEIAVVLWKDAPMAASIDVPEGTKLYFDVNGQTLSVSQGIVAFMGISGSEVYVTSSDKDAMIMADGALVIGATYADVNAGFKAHIGTYANAAYGIDGLGDNLLVLASQLVEYFGGDFVTYNNVAEISIDGGIYGGTTDAFPAYIVLSDGGIANISVNGAKLSLVNALLTGETSDVKITATVNNTHIVTTELDMSTFAEKSVIRNLPAGSTVSFTASSLSATVAPVEGTVTLGKECELAYPAATLPNVSLDEGVVFAHADYEIQVGYALFPVKGYIDEPEKLTHITWYDNDGTTVIGTSYNAVDGVIVDGESFSELVSLAVGTDWYEVRFTKWDIPATYEAGELAIYPICDTPVADVKCLEANLTVYTYFRINYYLPKNVDIEGFELIGITSDLAGANVLPVETVEIDGVEYLKYTETPGASDVSINTRYVQFSVDGYKYVYDFEFGVPKYAQTVMESDETSAADKKLIMNMVRYANETYKLAEGIAAGDSGLELYETLMSEHSELLLDYAEIEASEEFIANSVSDTSAIAQHISGATFMFGGAQPRFVFLYKNLADVRLPVEADGSIGAWPKDNEGVFTEFYYETWNGGSSQHLAYHIGVDGATANAIANGAWTEGDEVYAMTGDVLVCDIIQPIHLAVYGTDGRVVRGTYSLATYITNLEANGNGDFYDAAMSLYAFSLAAQEYGASTFLK